MSTLAIIIILLLAAVIAYQHEDSKKHARDYITLDYPRAVSSFGAADINHEVARFIKDYNMSDADFKYDVADKALAAAITQYREDHPIDPDPYDPDGINIIEYR